MEKWKQIDGFGGKYFVSDKGNIKTIDYHQTGIEKQMKPRIDNFGYKYINLSHNGFRKTFKVHRLVAIAFVENKNNFPIVNHKDENKTNNNADNLEWCTTKYNINYSFSRHNEEFRKRQGDAERKYHRRVMKIDMDGNVVCIYDNVSTAVRENENNKNIYACVKGLQSYCNGFKWCFC